MNIARRAVLTCTAVFLLGATTLPTAHGQGTVEQTISGTITDSTGAVVQSADVTVSNVATGIQFVVQSNNEGLYRTPPLQAGVEYQVRVSKQGFRTLLRQAVTLHLAEQLRLDLPLQPGAVGETVEVTGAAPLLETQGSGLSTTLEQKAVASMPLQDRRAGGLIQTAPGVYWKGEDALNYFAPRFNMVGSANTNLSIDGVGAAIPRVDVNQMALNPPLDSTQEVQIQAGYYGAEYGGVEGGLVRFTSKSGTNQLHGSLYEYLRNTIFDSRNYFAKKKGTDHYNNFGGSLGGPIVKNRAFFFVNLEGSRVSSPVVRNLTMPTAAEVAGDFSALSTPIYDPATKHPCPGDPAQTCRDPFPGNIIPANRLDPVSTKLAALYPITNTLGGGNVPTTFNNVLNRWAEVGKLDYQFRPKDSLTLKYNRDYYFWGTGNVRPAPADLAALPTSFDNRHRNSWLILAGETHTFSSSLVNNVRFAYRYDTPYPEIPGTQTGWAAKLGLPNVVKDYGFPVQNISGYQTLGSDNYVNRVAPPQKTYELHESLEQVKGKHLLKYGFDYQHSFGWNECSVEDVGVYNYSPTETAQPGIGSTGNGFASFLLGAVDSANVFSCFFGGFANTYWAPFVSDSIKATRNLTLDLGVRWEIDTPIQTSPHGLASGFDPYTINPISGTPGVITFQGQAGFPNGYTYTDWKRFEPRVALAYSLGDKTVIRAGFGIYGLNPGLSVNNAPAFGSNVADANFGTQNNGLTPAFYLHNGLPPYPLGTSKSSAYGAVTVGQSPNTSPTYVDPHQKVGYAETFNLSVQRELPGQIVVQATGFGNLGRRLPIQVDNNQLPPGLWGVAGNRQSVRPFPQFGSVANLLDPEGSTNYWAGVLSVTKRLSHGFLIDSSYTRQKALGILSFPATYFDHNLGRTAGTAVYDHSNNPTSEPSNIVKISSVYDLPFGPGKSFLNSGGASWIAGGWTIGGIFTYTTGLPVTFGSPVNSLNCFCDLGNQLNLVGNLAGPKTLQEWFNTSALAVPAFGTVGNVGPGTVIFGPSFTNLDMSLSKSTQFRERFTAQLMLEVFNFTNTPKFAPPDTFFGDSTFGQITSLAGGGAGSNVSPPWYGARIMQLGLHLSW